VEGWLNELLLLNIEEAGLPVLGGVPGSELDCKPSDCELFLLNKEVLTLVLQ
jgi:hypothetical protein